jgi:hypothetical protein
MPSVDIHTLALDKVGRILGQARARSLVHTYLEQHQKESIGSCDDLRSFGESLEAYGGMEQAVGALLMVQAVLLESADVGEP